MNTIASEFEKLTKMCIGNGCDESRFREWALTNKMVFYAGAAAVVTILGNTTMMSRDAALLVFKGLYEELQQYHNEVNGVPNVQSPEQAVRDVHLS